MQFKRAKEDMSLGVVHPMGKGRKKTDAQVAAMRKALGGKLKAPMTKASHAKTKINPKAVANLKKMAPYGGKK